MPKSKEELEAIKNEYNQLTLKLKELNEEELKHVTGGLSNEELFAEYKQSNGKYLMFCTKCGKPIEADDADTFSNKVYQHIGEHTGLDWRIPVPYAGN